MTKVYISPQASQVRDDNGVGRVIHAQFAHLPKHGIELVDSPEHADVIHAHIEAGGLPRVDVLSVHGLYFSDIPHAPYQRWHHEANRRIVEAARQARAIVVPSEWVAMCFKRDMRISPHVIGHGIDLEEWGPGESRGYILYNKNRESDVCSAAPAYELAKRGLPVVSTFAPVGYDPLPNFKVVGTLPHAQMKELIRGAGVYLATTKETFGIGTLEAMAAGVPVLGYKWGGTEDVAGCCVGRLVPPHDIDALEAGYHWIIKHRQEGSRHARQRAETFGWNRVMGRYAGLYYLVAREIAEDKPRISVVVTNYNYGAHLEEAIQSAEAQTVKAHEIIVVDDGSTDDSHERLSDYQKTHTVILQANAGVAAARNKGIGRATGNLIVCLDADDVLDPDYIARSLPHFKARDVGIVYPRLRFLKGGELSPVHSFPPPFSWDAQATPHNPPSNCITAAAMFRKEMWERAGGYQQIHAPGEDAEFWTRGLSIGYKAVRSDAIYHYRVGHQSASRTKQYKPIDGWHPWMRDKQFPMAAPQVSYPLVRSYSEPIVSVVIPVGPGHDKYLPAALDSLLGQTEREWEAIVVDDTTEGIAGEVLRPYPFCRIIKTLQGGVGAGRARNLGVAAATAPLTLFLDADDYLAPDALERKVAAFMAQEGKYYIYTDYIAFDSQGFKVQKVADYDQRGILETHESEKGIAPRVAHAVTVLIPTEWAKDVPFPDWQGWEEWGFFSECATKGYCGYHLKEPLLYYRTHTGQRREWSIKQGKQLVKQHKAQYGDYLTGKRDMCGCRGSVAGQTILGARSMLPSYGRANGNGKGDKIMALKDGREGVRYTGGRAGGFIIQGVGGGRSYNVAVGWEAPIGTGPGEVHPDDTDRFRGRGDVEYVPADIVLIPTPPIVFPEDLPKPQGATESELEELEGIGPKLAAELERHGVESVEDLRDATDQDLQAIPGIGDETLKSLREQTKRGRKRA